MQPFTIASNHGIQPAQETKQVLSVPTSLAGRLDQHLTVQRANNLFSLSAYVYSFLL